MSRRSLYPSLEARSGCIQFPYLFLPHLKFIRDSDSDVDEDNEADGCTELTIMIIRDNYKGKLNRREKIKSWRIRKKYAVPIFQV